MRSTDEKSLGDVIKGILQKQRLQGKLNETRIKDAWEIIMGNVVAQRTREIIIHEKTITLRIDSAPLKQELLFGKEKIKKLLNEHLGGEFIEEVIIQ